MMHTLEGESTQMKTQLTFLVALCLGAQLAALPVLAQQDTHTKKHDASAKHYVKRSSSRVNRYLNHTSKNVNHYFQHAPKRIDQTSKNVNHSAKHVSKEVNHDLSGKKTNGQ